MSAAWALGGLKDPQVVLISAKFEKPSSKALLLSVHTVQKAAAAATSESLLEMQSLGSHLQILTQCRRLPRYPDDCAHDLLRHTGRGSQAELGF